MQVTSRRIAAAVAALFSLAAATTAAKPPPISFNPQAVLKQWGEVLYCQEAYRHPDNAARVYEYDTRQCEAAEKAVVARLGGMTPEVRAGLREVAQREAARIRANTPDIAQVLSACRQTCATLAGEDRGGGDDGSAPQREAGP